MMDENDQPIEASIREFYEETAHYQQKMYDASAAYNQVVVLAGYAAFFGVWAAVADAVPKWVALMSGGLILTSVIIYVGWTVAGMVVLKIANDRIIKQIEGGAEGFRTRTLAAERHNIITSGKVMRFWLPVLFAAGGTAAVGATILAVSAISNAVRHLYL